MAELDLSQDTIRQRRNLVVTSVLLIFIKLADVSFGNSVNFLGATLSIGKPELIHQGILIFLLYFLWRFYQYFSTDKAYGTLINQYREYMKNHTTTKIVQLICKPKHLKGLSGEYLYKNLERKGLFKYTVDASSSEGYDPTQGKVLENKFVAEISAISLEMSRLVTAIGFTFRARILTDYFVPYMLVAYAIFLQFV